METATHEINLADDYFGFLKNLNRNSKLDLISKLSQSLKSKGDVDYISLDSLFGVYKSGETAEEIIDVLRTSRIFNRNIEPL